MASAAARLTVLVVLPTPPFWLATVSTRRCVGRGIRCRSGCSTRAARAASSAIGVHPGAELVGAELFHVERRTVERHAHPFLRRRTRSTTTTVLGGSTIAGAAPLDPRRCRRRAAHGARRPARPRRRRTRPSRRASAHPAAASGRHQPASRVQRARQHGRSPRRLPPIAARTRPAPRPGPARPRPAGRDRRSPRAASRPDGRAAPRGRSADPAGPAPTVSRAGPAPDPTSTTRAPSGTSSATTAQLRTCRSQTPRRLARADEPALDPGGDEVLGVAPASGQPVTEDLAAPPGTLTGRFDSGTAEDDDLAPRLLALALARHALTRRPRRARPCARTASSAAAAPTRRCPAPPSRCACPAR